MFKKNESSTNHGDALKGTKKAPKNVSNLIESSLFFDNCFFPIGVTENNVPKKSEVKSIKTPNIK